MARRYINKDSLVAEIERLKTIYNDDENIHHVAKYNILVGILSFLNTIEVKEVDLEKEIAEQIDKYYHECEDKLNKMSNEDTNISFLSLNDFAKHFFELGMTVSNKELKGE